MDWKDLNPYQPSPPQLLIHNKSQENEYSYDDNQSIIHVENVILDSTSSLLMHHLSPFHLEHCTTSTCLILPQLVENHVESSNSFQQLWSTQVYLTQLADFNTSENSLSILWSFIRLIAKSIRTGLYVLYSCANILRYDTSLFGFYYFLGILFGMNAYFSIDFLLIMTCIISVFVATYEKWLVYAIDLNVYDNINIENQCWRRIRLAVYGLAIGTISTYII